MMNQLSPSPNEIALFQLLAGRPVLRRRDGFHAQVDDNSETIDAIFTTSHTAIGRIFLAATEDGIVKIGLPNQDEVDLVDELSRSLGGRIRRSRTGLQESLDQLNEYLSGRDVKFDLDLDLRLVRGFRRQALFAVAEIPYGETRSYREIAMATGHPLASRAVGSACANNPLPLVIPCHRVVKADGQIGNYGGGSGLKERLLRLEQDA